MAGSDQSVNLGGMLSQMGTALGSMGKAGDGLTRSIEGSFMPRVDPNDPESLRRMMQWQNSLGRTDEAAVTMAQVKDMEAKRKEAEAKAEEERKLKIQGAVQAASARYRTALAAGDEAGVAREKQILEKMGEQFGVDAVGILSGLDKEKKASDLQAIQLGAAQSKQKAEQAATQINQTAAAVIDKFGVDSPQFQKLKEAPLFQENRDIVQTIEARELQLVNEQEKRAKHLADASTPPDISYVSSLVNDEKLTDKPELKELLTGIEERVKGKKAGQWLPTEKAAILRDINKLEKEASRSLSVIESAELSEERDFKQALLSARSNKVTETEIKNWQTANDPWGWNNTPSREEAIAGIIAEREKAIRAAFGKQGDSSGVREFKSEEEAEAANLPPGTKVIINGKSAVIE